MMTDFNEKGRELAGDYYAGLGLYGDAEKARSGKGFTYTASAFASALESADRQGDLIAAIAALHAAIASPKGVVPPEAERFYDQNHTSLNGSN